ncbi:MAG TPA: hypothetical protein VLS93_00830, partial [Anaeromyxobacteraceae bacterium]|nr:hypothetical protein [Anaeromyxobacteraceae bacterium]
MTDLLERLPDLVRNLVPDPGRLEGLFPALFPVFFLAMWLTITTILAWISGHMTLLSRFPPQEEALEEFFHFASGQMRGVSYSSALHVGIGSRGLHLAANWLFRPPFRRGIPCIPWREVRCLRPQEGRLRGWFLGSKFEIASAGVRFSVGGEAGRAIERKLAA